MQESIVVIIFLSDRIEVHLIRNLEFTWTDHFLNTPSLSLMIFFYAASDMLQFILASSILFQSTKFSWNMFCITNQDTATTFYIASYAYAFLNTYTCINNAVTLPELMILRTCVHVLWRYIFFLGRYLHNQNKGKTHWMLEVGLHL